MTTTVRVRLRKPPRVFTFIAKDVELGRNDPCVVKTDRGVEFGVCVSPPEEATLDDERRLKMTVLRRASHHDETTHKQIALDEKRAIEVCQQKVRKHDLPMRLVEAEYTFDRKKIVFYFTAEDRVDFRQLVKDLAFEMKTRIELRHIQVRDQAKLVGSIGTCGRELCCTTWMREFMPISMKMAKRQNLSLNPAKISGQCGRLMCCLAYENEMYEQQKRRPKPKPQEPEKLREEMESNRERAVEVLSESKETDVLADTPESPVTAAPEATEAAPAGTPEDKQSEEAKPEAADGKPPEGRRRRRGRRGGRGRKKKGGSG